MSPAFPDFLDNDATIVAQRLLGCELVRLFPSGEARVWIVETESYDQRDAASHSFSGRTPRTDVMFGPSGHLYVYFTYGIHYCMNVVTGKKGEGSAVLIRAVEPLTGEDILKKHRSKTGLELTNGPAKLCEALRVDRAMNGHDLRTAPLQLVRGDVVTPEMIVTTTRIGITKARDELRRFYIRDNPYVSKRIINI